MQSRFRGYNQALATFNSQAFREDDKQAFRTSLDNFKRRLESQLQETAKEEDKEVAANDEPLEQLFTLASFGRRLVLPTDHPLATDEILLLNRLYHAEATYLEETQKATVSSLMQKEDEEFPGNAFTAKERILHLSAAHEMARITTDLVAKSNRLTSKPAATDLEGVGFPLDYEQLLEEVFQVCQVPNDAGILLLSAALRTDERTVRLWFEKKRMKFARFFYAKATVENKGALARVYRKQLGLLYQMKS